MIVGIDDERLWVSSEERRRAQLMDADRLKFYPRGVNVAARSAQRATVELLKAYRSTRDENLAFLREMLAAAPVLSDALVLAHLYGRRRARLSHPDQRLWSPSIRLSFSTPIKFLQTRLEMPLDELKLVQQTYDAHALRIMQDVSEDVEKVLQAKLIDINRQGMHVREGAKELQRTLHAQGMSHVKPYRLEEIFRTQTQMAYSAGRWEMDQDPAIQEILWGYKYVAVGDDRTRETHQALNGVQAPKSDPIWSEIWPPNGYNCRCQVISIFDERKTRLPPSFTKDGAVVRPDKGFAWNPGQVFQPLYGKSYENWLRLNAEGLGTMILKAKGVMPVEYWIARYDKFLRAQGKLPGGGVAPGPKLTIKKPFVPEVGPSFTPGVATKVETKAMLEGLIEIDHVKIVGASKKVEEEFVRAVLKQFIRATGKPLNLKKVILSAGPKPSNPGSMGTFSYKNRTIKIWRIEKFPNNGPLTIGEYNVGNDLAATMRHEAGHAIQRTVDMDEWYKIYKSKTPQQWHPLVSEYGGVLRNELWAESVATYVHPEYIRGQLPKIIEDFMDLRFRKKLGKVPVSVAKSPALKGVEIDVTVLSRDNPEIHAKFVKHYTETVDDLHARFPKLERPRIKSLVIEGVEEGIESGVEGSFTEFTRELKVSAKPRLRGFLEIAEEEWQVDQTYTGLVRHEYAHAVQRDLLDSQWDDIWRSKTPGQWSVRISEYAAENSKELWAESFGAYTHPKYVRGLLPKQIEQYLDLKLKGIKRLPTIVPQRPVVKIPSMQTAITDTSGAEILNNQALIEWKTGLSEGEKKAFKTYTGFGYKDIRALELGKPVGQGVLSLEKVKAARDNIYAALDKAPKASGEAFRAIPRFRNEAEFARYEIGNTIEIKSLQSATYDATTFSDFLEQAIQIGEGKNPVVYKYVLRGHGGGAAIEAVSIQSGESEIMVRAGARFRVKSVRHDVVHPRGIRYSEITLEELPITTTVIDTRITTTVVDTRPVVKIPDTSPISYTDEVKAWTKTVTPDEVAGIDLFTGNGFDAVRSLEQGKVLTANQLKTAADTIGRKAITSSQIQKMTDDIYAALDRAPKVRGTSSRAIPRFRDEAEFKRYKVGNTIEIDALSSSTYDDIILEEFIADAKALTGTDPVVFRYNLRGHGGGISIESISASEHEAEIAIRRGARFKVKRVRHKVLSEDGIKFSEITLEELSIKTTVVDTRVWPSKSYEGWLKANAEGTGPMTLKTKGLMPPDYWIKRYDKFLLKEGKKPSGLGVKKASKKKKPKTTKRPLTGEELEDIEDILDSGMSGREIREAIADIRDTGQIAIPEGIETIEVSKLIPTQIGTDPVRIQEIAHKFDLVKTSVLILEENGKFYIVDGHHTVKAAKIVGSKLVRVKEIRKRTGKAPTLKKAPAFEPQGGDLPPGALTAQQRGDISEILEDIIDGAMTAKEGRLLINEIKGIKKVVKPKTVKKAVKPKAVKKVVVEPIPVPTKVPAVKKIDTVSTEGLDSSEKVRKWTVGLDEDELKAVIVYSEEGFGGMRAVESGRALTADHLAVGTKADHTKWLNDVYKAIDRAPAVEGTVYRAVPQPEFAKFRLLVKEGEIIETEALSSAGTIRADVIDDFLVSDPRHAPMLLRYELKGLGSGVSVEQAALFAENEVLIKGGSKFRVKSAKLNTKLGAWEVTLEEVEAASKFKAIKVIPEKKVAVKKVPKKKVLDVEIDPDLPAIKKPPTNERAVFWQEYYENVMLRTGKMPAAPKKAPKKVHQARVKALEQFEEITMVPKVVKPAVKPAGVQPLPNIPKAVREGFAAEGGTISDVKAADLIPTKNVSPASGYDAKFTSIQVVEKDGLLYVYSGHAEAAAAKLAGNPTIRVTKQFIGPKSKPVPTKAPAVKKIDTIDLPPPSTAKVADLEPLSESLAAENATMRTKDYKAWEKKATAADKKMLENWGQDVGEYTKIIESEFEGGALGKKWNKALDAAPKHKGTVWRGMDLPHDFQDKIYKEYTTVGNTIELKNSASATTSKRVAGTFVELEEDKVGEVTRNIILKVKTKTGFAYQPLAPLEQAAEREVILRQGTKYRVTAVKHNQEMTTAPQYYAGKGKHLDDLDLIGRAKYTEVTLEEITTTELKAGIKKAKAAKKAKKAPTAEIRKRPLNASEKEDIRDIREAVNDGAMTAKEGRLLINEIKEDAVESIAVKKVKAAKKAPKIWSPTLTPAPPPEAVKKVKVITEAKRVEIKGAGTHVDDIPKDKKVQKFWDSFDEDDNWPFQLFVSEGYTGIQAIEKGTKIGEGILRGRSRASFVEATKRFHKVMDRAPKLQGTVWRGAQGPKTAAERKAFKVGNTFEFTSTRSASRVKRVGEEFAFEKKNSTLFKIELRGKGAGIPAEVFAEEEFEVMIRATSKFEIIEVRQKVLGSMGEEYTEVTLREIGVRTTKLMESGKMK